MIEGRNGPYLRTHRIGHQSNIGALLWNPHAHSRPPTTTRAVASNEDSAFGEVLASTRVIVLLILKQDIYPNNFLSSRTYSCTRLAINYSHADALTSGM